MVKRLKYRMLNEFNFSELIKEIEMFNVHVEAFRMVHTHHIGLVIAPNFETDMDGVITLVMQTIKSYSLHITHVFYNEDEDSYLFECLAINIFGAN